MTTIAATGRYDVGAWTYRATLPLIEVDGPVTVIPGVGPVSEGAAPSRTETGLGDIVLSATYNAYYDRASTLGLDFTGKVKLPTADEDKGLGTGETDFAFLVDVYKTTVASAWSPAASRSAS